MAADRRGIEGDELTPARAREALRAIVDQASLPRPDPQLEMPVDPHTWWAVRILTAVFTELAHARGQRRVNEELDCYGCHAVRFPNPFASDHFARCPSHPAILRAFAVRAAIRLAPAIVDALGLEPVKVDLAMFRTLDALAAAKAPRWKSYWYPAADKDLRRTLAHLVGPRRYEYPTITADYVRTLEAAIDAWERVVHRESDPCPYCGAITKAEDVVGHLLHCERHPGAIIARRGLAALSASIGSEGAEVLVGLVRERDEQVAGLRMLLDACDRFDCELGWNGERAYARDDDEQALQRAKGDAARLIEAVERGYRPALDPSSEAASGPEFARPVWRALLRVGSNGPTPGSHGGTEEEVARLRAAADEALRLHEQYGEDVECPACARPGLWIDRAVAHVATCLLHPAIARRRAATAELRLLTAILREKRPAVALPEIERPRSRKIQLFGPSAAFADDGERKASATKYLRSQFEHLDVLVSPERRLKYASIVQECRDDLASPLSDWQRYRTAAESECPFCGEKPGFPALLRHLIGCSAHPDVRQADAAERALGALDIQLPGLGGRLQRQADAARLATARLLEYVGAFCSAFGDDDRGRATVPAYAEPGWQRARRVARAALASMEAESA